jgi:hypothetical protein
VICWHLFDGGAPRVVQTVILPLYCVSSCSGCLKISGRKFVCDLLVDSRLLDFLFTHVFDNRFDEFGDCQKRTAVVAFRSNEFSFHGRFHLRDRDEVC